MMFGMPQAQLSPGLANWHDGFMPKLDLSQIPERNATGYPPPFNEAVAGRWYRRLAPAGGLTEFGVSFVRLEPGAWSSHRHWHEGEDEFLVMVSGAAVLIDDDGEHALTPGDCVAWPKGERNGHHLINRSEADCTFVCMSGGEDAGGEYSDIDMRFTVDGYIRKDGTPYPAKRIR
jgi:uncharacterized cupin superfamily protein